MGSKTNITKINMKKLILLILAIFCCTVIWAQNDDVNTTSNDLIIIDDTEQDLEKEEIYYPVEDWPEFPGGQQEMIKFVQENLEYPKRAAKKKIQGRAICQFFVETDGSITGVTIVRSSGNKSLDKAAVRVVKKMPKWKPGSVQGKIQRMGYYLPVNFRIP